MAKFEAVSVQAGVGPVVLGMPHVGTTVPTAIYARLNQIGQKLADTDWHIDRLYHGLLAEATVVKANFHRYVIDANRDPAQNSLYPGQNTTTLCPATDFDGVEIWQPGQAPTEDDIKHRLQAFHQPYHEALRNELQRVHGQHGRAILFDCHSIRSVVPYLFEGQLPAFNIGSNGGKSCSTKIEKTVTDALSSDSHFDMIVNGRFKGGWTTRHYGEPDKGFHAIQLEMAQRVYMSEHEPWPWDEALAQRVRPLLAAMLENLAS